MSLSRSYYSPRPAFHLDQHHTIHKAYTSLIRTHSATYAILSGPWIYLFLSFFLLPMGSPSFQVTLTILRSSSYLKKKIEKKKKMEKKNDCGKL